MSEWIDPTKLADGEEQKRLHIDRYRWASEMVHGRKVANAACSNNYGAEILDNGLREIVGFDRNKEALEDARGKRGQYVLVEGDIEGQTFEGFDALVCLETIEHLNEPWSFLEKLAPSVKEIILSTPIIPTKHFNEWHLHDFTADQIRGWLKSLGWEIQQETTQDESFLEKPTYILIYATR